MKLFFEVQKILYVLQIFYVIQVIFINPLNLNARKNKVNYVKNILRNRSKFKVYAERIKEFIVFSDNVDVFRAACE